MKLSKRHLIEAYSFYLAAIIAFVLKWMLEGQKLEVFFACLLTCLAFLYLLVGIGYARFGFQTEKTPSVSNFFYNHAFVSFLVAALVILGMLLTSPVLKLKDFCKHVTG